MSRNRPIRISLGLLVVGGLMTVGGVLIAGQSEDEPAIPSADTTLIADDDFVPTEANLAEVRSVLASSGLDIPEYTIQEAIPSYDYDGNLAGVVALLYLTRPTTGELTLPGHRVAVSDKGEEVPVEFDVTYRVDGLEALSVGVQFGEISKIVWAQPGDASNASDADYEIVSSSPERRVDGKDAPIPERGSNET